MTELSIALPVLLVLVMGVVELSGFMLNHFKASRVAYEGARYMATYAGLTPGAQGTDADQRMARLIQRYQLPAGTESSYELLEGSTNIVEVRITVPFSFQIYPVLNPTVSASARAAYLYTP